MAETDLAEFILQVADEQPSHIIAPALHYSRERITALFKRKFTTDLPLDTGEELTLFAREKLREQFIARRCRHLRRQPDRSRQRLADAGGERRQHSHDHDVAAAAYRHRRHRESRSFTHRLRDVSGIAAGQRLPGSR